RLIHPRSNGSGPLLRDLRDDAGADGAATLADGEAQLLLHRDRRDQLHFHVHVVPRHHHLPPRRQVPHPPHVRGAEVELRPIPIEERRVPAPFLLGQHIHRRLELGMRRDRPRRHHAHPPLQVLLLDPPQQQPNVVPRNRLVHALAEHLHPRHHRVARLPQPHPLHLAPRPHLPALRPPRPPPPPPREPPHPLPPPPPPP